VGLIAEIWREVVVPILSGFLAGAVGVGAILIPIAVVVVSGGVFQFFHRE